MPIKSITSQSDLGAFKTDDARLANQGLIHDEKMKSLQIAHHVSLAMVIICGISVVVAICNRDYRALGIVMPIISALLGFVAGRFGQPPQ